MSAPTQGRAHRDDPHLQDRLNQIAEKITSPTFLSGQGLGNEIGFWIFDYPPEHELQVREYLTFLEGVLSRQHSELTVDHVNLLRVLRDGTASEMIGRLCVDEGIPLWASNP